MPELDVEAREAAIANLAERYGHWRPELAKLHRAGAELEREAGEQAATPSADEQAEAMGETGDDRGEA